MTKTPKKDRATHAPPILSDELRKHLNDRIFGSGDKRSLSEQMERDQRNADRMNAWVNRFSKPDRA